MTELVSRMNFLEFTFFHTSLYVLKGIDSFLVTSSHVIETDLVQFVVNWSMYIIIGKGVRPGYNLVFSLFDRMRTLMSWPSNVASICPTSKSEKVWENTNLDPPMHGMRCAIVALMTFLVVAAFNPERTLLNPSPKLGFPLWLSFSTCFIRFMTARPILICFLLSLSCVDLLVYKVL